MTRFSFPYEAPLASTKVAPDSILEIYYYIFRQHDKSYVGNPNGFSGIGELGMWTWQVRNHRAPDSSEWPPRISGEIRSNAQSVRPFHWVTESNVQVWPTFQEQLLLFRLKIPWKYQRDTSAKWQPAKPVNWRVVSVKECSLLGGSPFEYPAAGIRAVARLTRRSKTVRTAKPDNVAFPRGYTIAKPFKKAARWFGSHVVDRRARRARAKQQYAYVERKNQIRVDDQICLHNPERKDAAIVRRERQLWKCSELADLSGAERVSGEASLLLFSLKHGACQTGFRERNRLQRS